MSEERYEIVIPFDNLRDVAKFYVALDVITDVVIEVRKVNPDARPVADPE